MLPSVGRVRVEVARDHLVVIQEVHFPRGDWTSGDLDLYVAFGAPGVPRALDAHLVPVRGTDANLDETGDVLRTEKAPHRPVSAQPLIGRPNMAGVIVHVPDGLLRRALAPADRAALRLRSLVDMPVAPPNGMREVIVRLGMHGALPMTLSRIEVAGAAQAEATLCGPEADPYPLAIVMSPRQSGKRIVPAMATRHASDDLCIRF
jgi:hypothetical protein